MAYYHVCCASVIYKTLLVQMDKMLLNRSNTVRLELYNRVFFYIHLLKCDCACISLGMLYISLYRSCILDRDPKIPAKNRRNCNCAKV